MGRSRSRFVPWKESKAHHRMAAFRDSIEPADVVIAVTPSMLARRPAISPHLLQGCVAARTGYKVSVFYAHLFFASWVNERLYTSFAQVPAKYFLTERIFASTAFDLPPLGLNARAALATMWQEDELSSTFPYFCHEDFEFLATEAESWARDMATLALAYRPRIVGCTSMFEQITSSLGLLAAVKRQSPETITVLGGANCLDEMADGLASLDTAVDHFFAGECETVFPDFVATSMQNPPPSARPPRIIRGAPCMDMDSIPCPDYSEYYKQLEIILPEAYRNPKALWLPYESSRGCWWGAKDTCLFCGLNGDMLTHRQKSPERALEDLQTLTRSYLPKKVMAYDNIMPYSYFKTLLPAMKGQFSGCRFFYEQKSNIKLWQMQALKDANITYILPGIEAVSTSLLKRMHKGVTASQNVACLRYARACGVSVSWNLLYGFPGDLGQEYEETFELLPLLRHLNPPAQFTAVHLDRFSPYFLNPQRYGVRGLQPLAGYNDFLPPGAPIDKIAYQFECAFPTASFDHSELMAALNAEVLTWRRAWVPESAVHTFNISSIMSGGGALDPDRFPVLEVTDLGGGRYELIDSRMLAGTMRRQIIDREQARMALSPQPLASGEMTRMAQWALDNKVAFVLDGRYTPLATASPALIAEMESENPPSHLHAVARANGVSDGVFVPPGDA